MLWPRRSAVFMQIRAQRDGGKGYWSPVLRNLPETGDVELSGRFLLFEGLRQLVRPHYSVKISGDWRRSLLCMVEALLSCAAHGTRWLGAPVLGSLRRLRI